MNAASGHPARAHAGAASAGHRSGEVTARAPELALALLLVAAMLFGGGPRGAGDAVVHFAALPSLAFVVWRWRDVVARRALRPFLILAAAALLLVVAQSLPLPPEAWSALPSRAAIAADLQRAGLAPEWRALSLDPWGTLRGGLALVLFIGATLLAATLTPAARWRLLQLAVLIGACQALLGFAQAAAGTHSPLRFHDYHHPIGAIGTFANRNHYATLMAMLLPVALALGVHAAQGRRRLGARLAWHGVALALFLAAALSYSRAGFALTVLVAVASLFVLMTRTADDRPSRRARWLLPAALAGTGALAVATYAWDGLMRRLAQDPLDDLRWQYVRHGLAAAADYLPWGSGLGSFRWVHAAAEPVRAMTASFADRAHNDVLQVAVEAGVPGLALLTYCVTLLTVLTWRVLRNVPMASPGFFTHPSQPAVIALALWVPAIHSLVDYPLRTHAVALLLALLLSVLLGTSREQTASPA